MIPSAHHNVCFYRILNNENYTTPKVTKYQRCNYMIQNHQITIKIDKMNINLWRAVCFKIIYLRIV